MIIFLHGADTYRSRQKLKELKSKYIKDVDPTGAELAVLSEPSYDDFHRAVSTVNMFATKRCVVVEGFVSSANAEEQMRMREYLPTLKSGETIIIFWEDVSLTPTKKRAKKTGDTLLDFLLAQPYAQEFKALIPAQLIVWLNQEFRARHLTASPATLNLLTDFIGNDTWLAKQEIDKLSAYARSTDATQITSEMVELLSVDQSEANIFTFVDELMNQNIKSALELFDKLLRAGQSEHYLLSMITRQTRLLLLASSALEDNIPPAQLSTVLKQHPFVMRKITTQARRYSSERLKKIHRQLMLMDFSVKSGGGELRPLLQDFILNQARPNPVPHGYGGVER